MGILALMLSDRTEVKFNVLNSLKFVRHKIAKINLSYNYIVVK